MRAILLSLVLLFVQIQPISFTSYGGVYHLSTCSVGRSAPATTAAQIRAKRMAPCIVCHPENALARGIEAPTEAPRPAPVETPTQVTTPSQSPPVTVATRGGDVLSARLGQLSSTTIVVEVAGQRMQLPIADVAYISFVGSLSTGPAATAAPLVSPTAPVTAEPPAPKAAPLTSAPGRATPAPQPAPQPARQQCAATTQKGTRCSRLADVGSAFCWQHK